MAYTFTNVYPEHREPQLAPRFPTQMTQFFQILSGKEKAAHKKKNRPLAQRKTKEAKKESPALSLREGARPNKKKNH